MQVEMRNAGAVGARVWEWDKDSTGTWFLDGSHCGVCNARLGWKWGLESFCPECGVRLATSENEAPPVGEIETLPPED